METESVKTKTGRPLSSVATWSHLDGQNVGRESLGIFFHLYFLETNGLFILYNRHGGAS